MASVLMQHVWKERLLSPTTPNNEPSSPFPSKTSHGHPALISIIRFVQYIALFTMVSARSLLLIFLSSVPLLASARAVPRSTIEWGPCSELYSYIAKIPIECGTLAVPLDYTQPDGKTVNLQLLKFLAPKQPSRGTIQLSAYISNWSHSRM